MISYYKLDGHTPVPATAEEAALAFVEPGSRRVAATDVSPDVWVSTVFLCIDHRYSGVGPPILFETMIFGDCFNDQQEYQERYCTWEEAEAGHAVAVEYAKTTLAAHKLLAQVRIE